MVASGIYLRVFVINIMVTSFSVLSVVGSIEVPTSNNGEAFNCPVEVCRCGLDPRGRVKVVCDRGDLVDPIPIRTMDPLTEVLIIAAPDDKPNSLTIGPIFQVNINTCVNEMAINANISISPLFLYYYYYFFVSRVWQNWNS